MTDQAYMAWIDIETTGLDPKHSEILEIGITFTNAKLEIVEELSILTLPYHVDTPEDYIEFIKNLDPFIKDMHTTSGLIANLLDPSYTVFKYDEAEALLCDRYDHHFSEKKPMCGSSVHFDRGFLETKLPSFAKKFSYRNIDVSSFKEWLWIYKPFWAAEWQQEIGDWPKAHRALDDIHASIAELKFYSDKIG